MKQIVALTQIAKKRMAGSHDPIHDLAHVERVVSYVQIIGKKLNLDEKEQQALTLAAWWHDIGRTITKKPTFMFMSLIDDWISALMLWLFTIRFGLFGSVVGMSTRIIFCKGMASSLFAKVLLHKKEYILLDALQDADTIDMLNAERTEKVRMLVENLQISKWGYKFVIKWFLRSEQLKLKTKAALELLVSILKNFIEWISQKEIFEWHLQIFKYDWLNQKIIETKIFLNKIQQQNI